MARGERSLIAPVDLSGLESLFDELGDAAEEVARPAAQAAAQVFYDAAQSNVARIKKVSGNLASAIYQAFSPEKSGVGLATYNVSWNHTKAPVVNTKKGPRNAVRPEKQGQSKPRRGASQAEKDAYYVLRPDGPIYVPGKAFMRGAQGAAGAAVLASADVLWQALEKVK